MRHDFKQDPKAVLRQYDVNSPPDLMIKTGGSDLNTVKFEQNENGPSILYLPLPKAHVALNKAELAGVGGGADFWGFATAAVNVLKEISLGNVKAFDSLSIVPPKNK